MQFYLLNFFTLDAVLGNRQFVDSSRFLALIMLK